MDEFDPFVGGAATATADSSAKPGAFDPFATGAAKAKPGPIFTRPNSVERTDPNAHWRNLYGGLEGLDKRVDVTQARAFGALDKISRDPEEDRARAINQTFVANKLGMPDAALHANWDAVKSSFAKSELLIDQDKISDKTLYGWIGQRLNPPEDKNSDKGEIKPWTWTDTLVHDVGAIKREAARTWESIWKPLAELPAAPTNLPDVWINMRMNPLTDTPSGFNPAVTAGVYNGAIKPLVDGLLSPGGIATAGVGSGLGVAAESYRPAALALKGMSGVFAGIMADASIDSAAELRRLRADPNSTTQDQITALSSSATSGIMALFGALHMTMESNPARAGKIAEEMQGKAPAEGAAVLREEANRVPFDQKEPFLSTADILDKIHKSSGQPPPPIEVKAAAVLSPGGVITEGASHEEINEKGVVGTEGFTLTNGEFSGRDHAYEIAEAAGQLTPDSTKETKELKSDMLDTAKLEAAKAEATSIELAPADELLSSVKKASVNAQLVRMGFEPVTPTETKTWTEGVKGALERFEKDPERGANLVRRALSGERRFSTDDVWDSQIYERRLKDEVTTAEKRYDEALKIGDPVAIDVADAELYEKQANLKQASQAFNEVMGSEAGRALNARKAMLREDYSLAALERKYRKSIGSADIPEDVQKQLAEKSDKIAELERALSKSQEERARSRPPPTPISGSTNVSGTFRERLSIRADEARSRLKAKLSRASAGIDPTDIPDYAVIVADMIASGITKTAQLSSRLILELYNYELSGGKLNTYEASIRAIKEISDKVKPHVDEIVSLAKDYVAADRLVAANEQRKSQLENQIKKLTDKISAGDLATEGVKANRPSVEEIEKLEQKRDAARETLSAMREEAARISELEQAIAEKERQIAEGDTKAKGKPANRPAKEQQEKLLRERDELNKQIAEARKEAAKPSAADKITDAVADIEQEIAAKRERLRVGDLAAKKQPVNRPQVRELEIARQELDKVNTEIAEARKGPPASPEQMRSRDLDRQIAELERQIRTEEVFPEGKGEAPKSPEIAAKEKQLASLKEERNNIRDRLQPSAEPPTKEEAALKAWRTRTEKEIARLEAGIPKPESVPVEIPFTPEDLEKKKRLETLKRDFARDLRKNEEARRPLWLRGVDKVKWFAETSILTSLGIFLKIPVSAFWKTVTAPIKELAGTVAGKAFPDAAKYAPMQVQPTFASLLDTEGKAAKATFTEGARAAGEAVRNRLTTEETLFVPDSMPPEGKDFVRSIHRALHLPAQINEFTRRVATIENNLIAAGKGDTLSDPAVWSTVRVRAYTEAYRAAYLEKDALLSGLVNATIRSIEQKGKKYNAESLAAIMTMVIEMDNPVKNVPVNIISQTGEAMTGSVIGTAQILKAYKNGFENMKPGDLDAAFRRVKNGTVGALAMVGAWYAYESIGGSKTGGSYTGQPDKKRKANEPKEGQVKVGDTMLPEMGFHNETWAAAQMIASYHHLLDEQYGKKTVETHADAFLRAALGPLKDVPGIKQSMIVSLAETKEPTKSLAQWTAARTIPAGVAQIARWIDTKGDLSFETFMKKPNQRFTRDAVDEFKVRIPGERETVPATKSQKKRDIEERLRK